MTMAKVEASFKVGSLVFAKLRGFPYWPARVESKVEGTYYVYFFGTHETTALNVSNLLPFNEESKKKYGRVKRKFFAEAMETIQQDPSFKADCVFNIPGTTQKKSKPATQSRKRKSTESAPVTILPQPKAPREPPKRRSPIPEHEPSSRKREKAEEKLIVPPLKIEKKSEIVHSVSLSVEQATKQVKESKPSDLNETTKKNTTQIGTPIVYDYMNSEKSPAEMGRLPLMKRKEAPKEIPPTTESETPVVTQPTEKQEVFSSPIKKRKLSPPKKAPERYLEVTAQRRNSSQRKENSSDARSEETASEVSDSTSEIPKAAKIVKRSSGSQPGNRRASANIEFQPRQMVFAKVKGYPFWPARVDSVVPGSKPNKYHIFFYGTHEHAKLMAKDLLPVTPETKEKHGKPNKRSKFSEGLVEMQLHPWIEFPGSTTVTSSTVPVSTPTPSCSVPAPPIIPPVTLVPQLNVQQTSPHSPQDSSQKTGSDKDDSESFSDSSDSN